MARNTSKMTLYEVTKKVAKVNESSTLRSGDTPPKVVEVKKTEKKPDMSMRVNKKAKPSKRPLLATYKRRRSLLTRPYVAIFVALAIVWVVWMVTSSPDEASSVKETENDAKESAKESVPAAPFAKVVPADPVMNVTVAPPTVIPGDHVIVLAHYITQDELGQVQAHFAENGFETVIEKTGALYVLVTKNRYQNPNNRGTDGYSARQRLIEVGAEYKAPPGFRPFKFNDIYGKKVN